MKAPTASRWAPTTAQGLSRSESAGAERSSDLSSAMRVAREQLCPGDETSCAHLLLRHTDRASSLVERPDLGRRRLPRSRLAAELESRPAWDCGSAWPTGSRLPIRAVTRTSGLHPLSTAVIGPLSPDGVSVGRLPSSAVSAMLGASLLRVVARTDPFRPAWTIRTPSGRQLRAEYDRLRNHWRVSPGGYVRRELADALGDATGSHPDAGWIVQAVRQTSDDLAARTSDPAPAQAAARSGYRHTPRSHEAVAAFQGRGHG